MTGEQFYDSLTIAIHRPASTSGRTMTRNEDPVRRRFLYMFGHRVSKVIQRHLSCRL